MSDWYFDFHIGGDSLSVGGDWETLTSCNAYLKSVGSKIRGVVLEENGGLHSIQRALGHARRSNRLHCLGDFMRADTPANGLQVLGRNDNSWDQGQLFITQNMTYLAPAGVAQVMLAGNYGSHTLAVDDNAAWIAVGETVVLLHLPPSFSGCVSIAMERGRQQNDSLANG